MFDTGLLLSLMFSALVLQNPLKMPKKLVPRLRKNIEYKPRSQESQSDWRGRMRVGTAELVQLTVS